MTRHKRKSFPEQLINVKLRHINLLSLKPETKPAVEVKYNTNPAGPLSLYPWSAVLAKQQQRKYKIPRFTFSDIVEYNAKYFDCFVGVFFNTTSSKLFKICPKLNLFFLLQSLVLYIQDYSFSAVPPDFLKVSVSACCMLSESKYAFRIQIKSFSGIPWSLTMFACAKRQNALQKCK